MRILATSLMLAVGLLIVGTAQAADCCAPAACDPGCGDQACCQQACCCPCCGGTGVRKVCRVVCDTTEITTHCWEVECEEFCVPLPGIPCLGGCGQNCCGQGCAQGVCAQGCCGVDCGTGCGVGCGDACERLNCLAKPLLVTKPLCGPVRCRKKLVKKECKVEVPTYRCEVVCVPCNCCNSCDSGCDAGCVEEEAPAEAPSPAVAPAPDASTTVAPLPPVIGTSYLKALQTHQ